MLSRGNILVVDDEVNLCRILDAKLTKSGYEVMTVHDGLQAVEKVQEKQFDLVLLDLILPKLDGLEALEKIRQINSDVPVIIMTACENTDAVTRALSQGASAFVSKPFDLDRLVTLVQSTSAEPKSINSETTMMDGSGIFRAGQQLSIETAEKREGSIHAKLIDRKDTAINVQVTDGATNSGLKVGDIVEVFIRAIDAQYRFQTKLVAVKTDTLSIEFPQVMYRVQRRKYPRVGLKAVVVYKEEGSDSKFEAYSEDIGVGGISIITENPITPGKRVALESSAVFHLDRMHCQGEVLRCNKVSRPNREQYKVALKFTDPDPELRRALLQHLALAG